MPVLPFFQVDAFSNRAFAGNPAAVCPLDQPLDASVMQDIAAENNLSETAFFVRRGEEFDLRWFTPTTEVDLCGHATLASGFVVMTELDPGRTEVRFNTASGAVVVRRSGSLFILDFPALPGNAVGIETAAALMVGLGTRPVEALRAKFLLAVFDTAEQVRALAPDMEALARIETGVCATAPGDQASGTDFVLRYFAPSHGIPEDPVTGSAHCTLIPYWAGRLGKAKLFARQLSRRGGDIHCELAGDRVFIGGHACLVIKGAFTY